MRNNIHSNHKSAWISLIGLGAGIVLFGIGCLATIRPKELEQSIETPIETTTEPTAPTEKKSTLNNPFTETISFKRTTTLSGNTAILEIKVDPKGDYTIKECITGEIVSKGVWSYSDETAELALTEVGSYPYYNIFRLEEYQKSEDSVMDSIQLSNREDHFDTLSNLTNPNGFEPTYQLAFVTEGSTNIKYELLNAGDVFIEQEKKPLPEQTQLSHVKIKKGDV